MKNLIITIKPVGENGLREIRTRLNEFVKNNFWLLYEGAVRIGCNITADYYAAERVQIGDTRLHREQALKYAGGHKYNEDASPTEKQLRQTVKDLQTLIDAAAVNIPPPFILNIIETE